MVAPDRSAAAWQDTSVLLDGLNDAQLAAVTSTAAPLCILAGAGSGKTRVLTRRIAYRAATGDLDPRHVLALTFTRKAAGELTARLRALGLRDSVAAGTFHSVAYAQLRSFWTNHDIRPPALLDRKVGFVARLLTASERGSKQGNEALDIVGEIEWAKARMVAPDGYVQAAEQARRRPNVDLGVVARVYERYEEDKRQRRMVDFDDLLAVCHRHLTNDEHFASTQRWRHQHLFVDEFQDVNPLQQALLTAWLGDRVDLCVVGDPNQAIYAWNGADPRILERFPASYPTTEVVRLADNYRSSPQILAVANAVLGRAAAGVGLLTANRPDGPIPSVRSLGTAAAEATAIARAVRDRHRPGARWGEQAVLVRTNAQTGVLEEALHDAGIPFRVRGGSGLLEQPDIKRVLRELGRSDAGSQGFGTVLADLDATASELEGDRKANLQELIRLGHDFAALDPAPSAAGFLSWLNDTARSDQPDIKGDAVEVATFHAAKGLEWPIVHLAGLEDGMVPIGHARTPDAIAEEKRLFYVAVTRAERELCCTWAEKRTFGTREVPREPSPYLDLVHEACDRLAGVEPRTSRRPSSVADPRRNRPATSAARERAAAVRANRPGRRRRPEREELAPDKTMSGRPLDETAQEVLVALKAWRGDRAKAAAMPPYVIFHDRTLEAIAAALPRTHHDLLVLPGLGEVKVSRYGDDLLGVVAERTRQAEAVHFTIEQRFAADPARVMAAYTDPALYPTLTGLSKVATPEVLDVTPSGTDVHVRLRMRFVADVSGAVSAVIDPGKVSWVQDERYDLAAGRAVVEFQPDSYADRFSCSGGYTFAADPDNPGGTLRTIQGDLKVRVLLVGGQVEKAMVSGLTEHFAEEQPLVARWLDAHA